jgi:membrane protease subunit (stomatin/prohibitin family)
MSDTLQDKIARIARATAFPSSEDATEGMTYRAWLEGQVVAQLAVSVASGVITTADAAQVASDMAGALVMQQAMRTMPKVTCAVCQQMATSNPCDECGPTLNDEEGVDLAAALPAAPVKLCPDCGKAEEFDSANPCNHDCHYPF